VGWKRGGGGVRAVWQGKVTKYVTLSLENEKYTQEVETGITEKQIIWYNILHDMIYLLIAIGLKPGGSSTVHIYI